MALGTNNADQILVGSSGAVFTAPVGTALPTAHDTALNAAFKPVGYITPAGPNLSNSKTINDIMAWQSFHPIASRVTGADFTVGFEIMEWDANTLPLAFGGGVITEPTADHYKFTPSDPSVLDERALVLDVHDGNTVYRYVFPRGYQTGNLDTAFTRDDPAVLPIEFKVLAPTDGTNSFLIYSNSSALDSAIAAS